MSRLQPRGYECHVLNVCCAMGSIEWACFSLLRYVNFCSSTVLLRTRSEVVVLAQLQTLSFELTSRSRITLSESVVTALNRLRSGFPLGQ